MQLEKVVLNGFKSFADKTEFSFNNSITAIVGPNGCGKSNVVDAVKWVLGEQSAKNLRSGNMADVIFSGSSSRKAASMAEVSLFFADVAGSDENKLNIGRRLYKNGDSEYVIDGKTCRLKDIREKFMDTGLGTRAYSIIEQGQVEQLVTANKIDRRGLFEEAAGISKFKAQKKEAIRKLDRTEQNLLRLADIVNEVQKQLRSIKLQAGKARNFLQHSQRLKELRVNYSLAEYHSFKTKLEEKNSLLSQLSQNFSAIVAEVGRNDSTLSQLSSKIISSENTLNRNDNSLTAVKGKIEQHKERIVFLSSRITDLLERKSKASENIQKLSEQNKKFQEQIEVKKKLLEDSQDICREKEEQIKEFVDVTNEISLECDAINARLEDEKSGIIDIVRRVAGLHNEIGSLNVHRDNLADQKEKLHNRAGKTEDELRGLLENKAQYQHRLEEIGKIIIELTDSLDKKRNKADQLDSQIAEKSDDISALKQNQSALESELKILKDMEQKREGINNAVKNILKMAGENPAMDYIDGILADVIQAQSGYENAVEAALDGLSDAVVVNSTSKLLNDEQLKKVLETQVNFICSDRIAPFKDCQDLAGVDNVIARAVELVEFDAKYTELIWQLMGKTIVVKDIPTALKLWHKLNGEYKIVTIDGQLLRDGYILRAGSKGKATGLISRKTRLVQIENDLAEISVKLNQLNSELEKDSRENKHLSSLCQELRTSIYEANTEKTESNGRLNSIEQNIERLTREKPLLLNEIKILQEQIANSLEKEQSSKDKLEELEDIKEQRDKHIDELQDELNKQREKISKYNDKLTELKVELSKLIEQRRSYSSEIASLQSQIQHARITLESARNDLLGCDGQIEQSQQNILKTEAEISELFMQKEQIQRLSAELNQELEELRKEKEIIENKQREIRRKQSQIEEELNNLKVQIGQTQVKQDDLCQRIQEELSMDLAEAYQNYEHEDTDWEAIREEIGQLRSKIERLGNVNVDAIEEQKTLEERNDFITKQLEDLNQSKDQLEQLINKINRESKEKFRITFEQIRENFRLLFRKLFGGGKADIILDNPEDILESGIDIIARPPGKEQRSISLLSGGEKTMTAIAMLFAVFKSKPSPFCILDEVDAALDEANNERFNLIVEEFKDSSQFIIVTHSKRTMSIADLLYGVTMQTQGVSKKISVKFDQDQTAVA